MLWTYRKEVGRRIALLPLQVGERGAELSEQGGEARSKGIRVGVLEVDVDTVEAVVLDQCDGTRDERCTLRGIGDEVEVAGLRVRPSADGEQDLEVPTYGECRFSIGERGAAASLSDLWLSLRR